MTTWSPGARSRSTCPRSTSPPTASSCRTASSSRRSARDASRTPACATSCPATGYSASWTPISRTSRSQMPERLVASLDGPPGAPVVVLGNSLGTTRELWEPQAGVLGGRFRLLRYEHRGHGGSPAPPGPYDIAGLAADVLQLLDDFGIAAASYCGISLGGMIGMWLAAHAPERIGRASCRERV